MGEPANPSDAETALIRSAAYPAVRTAVLPACGNIDIPFTVNRNGVMYFELKKRNFTPDRGYDYDRVLSFH